jgi:hypothetical protein
LKNPIASVYCSGNNPAPNRSFKQAMCQSGMPKRLFIKESVMRGFGRGFVVNLEKLAVLLEYVSYDVHRWEMIGDDTGEWGDTQRIVVRYSNPGDPHLPNPINFRFPCLSDGNPLYPARLACIHASLAEPVLSGLYFDGERVKYDLLEDWGRFWPPIIRALLVPGS